MAVGDFIVERLHAWGIDRQIAEQKVAIAEMPEPVGPSPEAAMATIYEALAENDLVKLKNKRTRRKIASRKARG